VTCGKKLYRCTCTFLALNYCCVIFFQIPQLSIRSGAHNLFPDFWTFRNFDRNFANIMAPSSDENENCIALLKGRSLPRKMLKTASKLIHKPRRNYREAMIVELRTPSNAQPAGSERDRKQTQEAQLMLTTGSTRLSVSRGQHTWYHSTCYI